MAGIVIAPENPGPIKLPAWDDVLHIAPRPAVNAQQRAAYNRFRNSLQTADTTPAEAAAIDRRLDAGELVAPGLTPAQQREIARRQDVAERIRESAVPQWRQQVIKVLTAADNVEDLISTAEWISRPLQAVIPGGRVVGRAARGTSSALDRVQQVLRGPSIIGRGNKPKSEQERRANARSRKTKVRGVARAQQWVQDNFGKLLEAGQAADTVTGVGISLGGIFGAFEEAQDRALLSAWHGGKAVLALSAAAVPGIPAELAEVLTEQGNESINEVRRTGVPLVEQIGRAIGAAGATLRIFNPFAAVEGAQRAVESIRADGLGPWLARASGAAAILGTENPGLSAGDHAAALFVSAQAAAPLAAMLNYVSEWAPQARIAELPMPPTRVTNAVTRAIIEDLGARFDARGRALGEWAEPRESVLQWTRAIVEASTRARATWLPQSFRGDAEQLLHALTEAHLPTSALLLTGAVDGITTQYEPAVRAELLLHHTGVYPPPDVSDQALRAWMDAQIEAATAQPDDYDERTWRAITARFW